MISRSIIVAALAIASTQLGSTPASAVANGTLATAGQHPFAVQLTMKDVPRPDGSFADSGCSAALISSTWIITAGHCFHDIARTPVSGRVPYDTTATLNTVDSTAGDGEVRKVTWVQQAEGTDIAIAKLSAPVTNVKPLKLASDRPSNGTILTIAGWGATSSTNPAPQTRLSTGQTRVTAVEPKTISVVGHSPAADTSACSYDSGAPYFTTAADSEPRLVSVEKTGDACPHATPETTSRVDIVASWIKATIRDCDELKSDSNRALTKSETPALRG